MAFMMPSFGGSAMEDHGDPLVPTGAAERVVAHRSAPRNSASTGN